MNEELKVIISAEVGKLKQGIKQAKDSMGGFSNDAKKHSASVEKALAKVGDAAKKAGAKIGDALKKGAKIGTAAVVGLATAAVKNFADYEQLVGGIDTLFKDSSKKVQDYAANAYKTAGMSANKYMETTTSFSASLLQSLGGDTNKAAEYANQAVIDMSDNANKMGTSIDSINQTYQSLARGNFGMLDNLKLGYGGTKAEMERLLADAEKLTGKKFDISNFGDITQAIHAIQTEMGITGTTSREATETISGSLMMAKGAFSNLLTGIADDNANFDELVNNFVESVGIAFQNLIPRITIALQGVASLIQALLPMIIEQLPVFIETFVPILMETVSSIINSLLEQLPAIIEMIMTTLAAYIPQLIGILGNILIALVESLPTFIEGVVQLVLAVIQGISETLPKVIDTIIEILPEVINTLMEAIPQLLEAGIELFMSLVNAIPEILPPLLDALPQIIETYIGFVIGNFGMVLDGAIQLFMAIINAIPIIIPELIGALPDIIDAVLDGIMGAIPDILAAGIELFMALVSSIPVIIPDLINALGSIVDAIIENLVNQVQNVMDFDWSFPDIKMPHFSVKGKFSLDPPSVPTLAIDWYAKGGVFDKPTLFNYGNGSLGGLGEAGAEAVVPLEKNTKWLDRIAERLGGTGQPIILQVDGKTFAETSIETINNLTKQTGKLGLVIA